MDTRVKTIVLDRDCLPALNQIDATSIPEASFERTVIRLLASLYPSCYVFSFKPSVAYNGTNWRPDLALVEKSMGFWFVIEVETATHSLQRHIVPQITAFRFGDYGEEASRKLCDNLKIGFQQAQTLIKHIPRYVAVVSNADNLEWENVLTAENVQFVSISGFQDVQGQTAHMVTGVLKPAERSLCFGTVFATLKAIRFPRTEFWRQGTYRVTDSTGTGNWQCVLNEEFAWLSKKRGLLESNDRAPIQALLCDDSSILLRTLI